MSCENNSTDTNTSWIGRRRVSLNNFLCRRNLLHDWNAWVYKEENSCKQRSTCKRCGKEKLRIAKHQWGKKKYKGENSCDVVRVCSRCEIEKKLKTKHQFGEKEYKEENSCEIVRTCIRCGIRKNLHTEHQWGKWSPSKKKETKIYFINKIRNINNFLQDYSSDEIKNICFELHIDFENLNGDNKRARVNHLLQICMKNNRMEELLQSIPSSIDGLSEERIHYVNKLRIDLSTNIYELKNLHFDWDFNDKDSCLVERNCLRCGVLESKWEHLWGPEEYISNTSCDLIRYCKCCGEMEKLNRSMHSWGEWKYDHPSRCTVSRKCDRCGAKDEDIRNLHVNHKWIEDRNKIRPCEIERYCERCGAKEKISEEHLWKQRSNHSHPCVQIEYCIHCKKERKRNLHIWDEMKLNNQLTIKVCRRCGMKG